MRGLPLRYRLRLDYAVARRRLRRTVHCGNAYRDQSSNVPHPVDNAWRLTARGELIPVCLDVDTQHGTHPVGRYLADVQVFVNTVHYVSEQERDNCRKKFLKRHSLDCHLSVLRSTVPTALATIQDAPP